LIGGGLAIATDRLTLRVAVSDPAARRAQLQEVRSVHGVVLVGLILIFLSGVLLAAADIETFLGSPVFWTKLVFVAALLVNGALLTRAERRLAERADVGGWAIDDPSWARVKLFAVASLILWSGTAVVGIVLSNAA
ncbi:MAG TPA: hypothetical protein VIP11_06180, partial [Gemmatimonadaceae bacterium]